MEELTIEVFQAQFGSSGYKVLQLFERIRGVKRARIYGSTTGFPEYVEWLQDTMMTPKERIVEAFDVDGKVAPARPYDIWVVSGNTS